MVLGELPAWPASPRLAVDLEASGVWLTASQLSAHHFLLLQAGCRVGSPLD